MTLRDDFENILKQYGQNFLLIHSDNKVRCSCWNVKRQEADRECPVCFGLGYVPIIQKETARSMDTTYKNSLATMGTQPSFGKIMAPGELFYMRHDVQVTVQDLILQVEWTATGKPLYNGGALFQVSHVTPHVFENQEIIYKSIYAQDQPIDKAIRGIRIANTNGIKNYELIRG